MNYDQQIEKLKNEKNLLIDNEAYAKEILKQTSYYSLIGGYKDIFKNPTISYYFTEKNGENQKEYLDTSNYNYSGNKNQRDIDRLIKILEGYVIKPTDYHYINHSQKKYGNVPLWVLTNALTFGNI